MKSELTFAVLLGGALTADARVRSLTAGVRAIAADGGMAHAFTLSLEPELWVGDFDSAPADLLARYDNVPRMPFPAEKNFTDGELAIEQAILRGATRLVLVGAFGGERTDHGLLHLLQAVSLAERGLDVMLTSGDEEAYPLLPGVQAFDLPAGSLFSVLGLEPLTGLCLEGVKYPLDNADIGFGSSRTLSNIAGPEGRTEGAGGVRVHLNSGRALLLARPHDSSGS